MDIIPYDEIVERVKALVEPEFAQRWPYANTTTVSVEVDNLIERVMSNTDELAVDKLFEACIKQM